MTATAARIAFITEQYRRAVAGPDTDVETRYGALARDNLEPVETFFDSVADAEAVAAERLTLLGATRRMLSSTLGDAAAALTLDYIPVLPTVAAIDDERNYATDAIVVSIEIDLEDDRAEIRTWG